MDKLSKYSDKIGSLSLKRIFFVGLFIRFLLMPISGHWDLSSLHFVASSLFQHGPFSFYYTDIAIYPPLTYLTLAFWQYLIRPFVASDFNLWLNTPIINEFFSIHAPRYFFLLKLMFIPFDLGIAYLLSKFGRSDKESKLLSALWLFNPVVLYVVFMWGTIDVIPTFLTLLAMYLIVKRKNIWGFIFIGLGASFKMWPLLVLPYVVLSAYKEVKPRIKAFILGSAPFLLLILPYLRIESFRSFVLASDRVSLIGNAGLYIGFMQWLLIYLLAYVLGLFWVNKYNSGDHAKTFDYTFLVMIFFYITSAFTPQWFLWILPFIILQVVEFPILFKPLVFVAIGYLLVILTFDIALSLGLFAPIEPTLWQTPFIKEYVERAFKDFNRIWSIFRTLNSAFLIWYAYEWWCLRRLNDKKNT